MSAVLRWLGSGLMAISLLGLLGLGLAVVWPAGPDEVGMPVDRLAGGAAGLLMRAATAPGGGAASGDTRRAPGAQAHPREATGLAITRVVLPAIALDAEVVPSALVPRDGGLTWEVPAFRVGHAEGTAGAGALGNGLLLGHVTSLRSGNVFADLDRAAVGDLVQVFAGERAFDYTVVSTRHVARDDRTVAEPGDTRAVSLITCTGVWLPTIWDYTERLVVRAELSQDSTHDR